MASLLLRRCGQRCASVRLVSSSSPALSKVPRMPQVEVDEDHVKQKLGNIQVRFKTFDPG